MSALLLLSLLVSAPPSARAPGPAAGRPAVSAAALRNPVLVKALRFEVLPQQRQGIYTGNVRVRRGETQLRCDRLVAHYNDRNEIVRVECEGNVEVSDGDRWAKGERAQFDNLAGMLEVTGSPEARQGQNRLWADRILYDLNRDSLRGEGNVRTVFETGKQGLPQLAPKKGKR